MAKPKQNKFSWDPINFVIGALGLVLAFVSYEVPAHHAQMLEKNAQTLERKEQARKNQLAYDFGAQYATLVFWTFIANPGQTKSGDRTEDVRSRLLGVADTKAKALGLDVDL